MKYRELLEQLDSWADQIRHYRNLDEDIKDDAILESMGRLLLLIEPEEIP